MANPTRDRRVTAHVAVVAVLLSLLGFLMFRDHANIGASEPLLVASAAHLRHRREGKTGAQDLDAAARAVQVTKWAPLNALRRPSSVVRWMAIGDSITQAIAPLAVRGSPPNRFRRYHPAEGTCPYLTFLRADAVTEAGLRVELVGPFHEAAGGAYSSHCLKPDAGHAATWGITAEAVSSNRDVRPHFRPLHINSDGTRRVALSRGWRVYDWVRKHKPTVVSILLGTNDLSAGTSASQLLDDYIRPIVIQILRAAEDAFILSEPKTSGSSSAAADAPLVRLTTPNNRTVAASARRRCDVVVLLLTLLPRADLVPVGDFNELIERRDRAWMRNPCIDVLPIGEGLNATDTSIFYDGLHPTDAGSRIIARTINAELMAATRAPGLF